MKSENRVSIKKMYNQSSTERYDEARIIGGNPNGIINFNKTNHPWAKNLFDAMESRTWSPKHINISKDKTSYSTLTEAEKRAYDLTLAQLITNDSIQTVQLMDGISRWITSTTVCAAISKQAVEEAIHSYSYSIMAEDIACDTDYIFNLQHKDKELFRKNQAVGDMYDALYKGVNPTKGELLEAFVANQILEELVFPGGFIVMFTIGEKMPGTTEMIAEIAKDETFSHVPLFREIFRTAVSEEFDGILPKDTEDRIITMITKMCEAEKRWTKYVSKGLLGFSDTAIDTYIEGQANSVCRNLRIKEIYQINRTNPLRKLLDKHLIGGEILQKGNFFESNIANYTRNSLESDY